MAAVVYRRSSSMALRLDSVWSLPVAKSSSVRSSVWCFELPSHSSRAVQKRMLSSFSCRSRSGVSTSLPSLFPSRVANQSGASRASFRSLAGQWNKQADKDQSIKTVTPEVALPKTPLPKRENIYTVPNFLTFTRLISAPAIGYLVVRGQTTWALGLFAYSCLTDYVDGYIARKYKLQTVVGSVIDPMADKFLMMSLATTLAVSGDIPLYMAVLILGRDFLLGLSALYFRYISLPPPKTFVRYWDFSIPSAEVHPTVISKYNTFLQMLYLGCSLINPVFIGSFTPETASILTSALSILGYTTATTTVLSGLSYVFSSKAVKILK